MHRHGKGGFTLLLIQLMAVGTAFTVWAGAEIDPRPAPAGVSSDWWTQAQAHIRQGEYQPSLAKVDSPDQPQTLQAPNRAHHFRTTFTADGVLVVPRTASAPEWSWGLTLTGLGAPGELRPTEPAQLRHEGNRVELVRGPVIEWYRNDERGLEQGFTLPEPPQGSAGTAELVLRLAVQGTLSGSLEPDGSALTFAAPDGRPMLRFDHLVAVDAVGRHLPARFGLDDGNLEIIVATVGAQFPILIDPLATSASWSGESNQASAYFGYVVAAAGDVNGDGFDDVVVGAPMFDNGHVNEGAVFVFHGSATGLSPTHDWTAESNQANAQFGSSVATAGDVNDDGYADVIVGAHSYDNPESNEGSAFIYHGFATGLSATPNRTLDSPSDQAEGSFGYSVATAGDVNNDGYADVIVGARSYDNPESNEGSAFIYHGSATGLSATPNRTLDSPSDQAEGSFGYSVATAGDVNNDGYADVIVGAPNLDNPEANEGTVFIFHGSNTGIGSTPNRTLDSPSDQAGCAFGYSVASAGDVNGDGYADVVVGAPTCDNGESDEGVIFIYHGSNTGLGTTPNLAIDSDQASALFGWSVATAGDINGDGHADVIVGAPNFNHGQNLEGMAFLFHGSATGLTATPGWTFESDQAGAWLGYSVSSAGDINHDGAIDVIVGAATYSNGQAEEGRAFVFYGSAGSFFLIPNPAGKPAIIYLE